MTRQEMFDRAVRGLAAQGWVASRAPSGACLYNGPNGRRCAWGHVDPDGPFSEGKGVRFQRESGRGLAAHLDEETLVFAIELQAAHDRPARKGRPKPAVDQPDPNMEPAFRALGRRYGLTWPL